MRTTDDGDSPLLTVPQVAAKLQVSKEQVYRWCASGQLPSVLLGPQTRRVRGADLDAWIADRLAA